MRRTWLASFLVLPLMGLVYVSYRIHVGKLGKEAPAAAGVQESVASQTV